MRISLSFIRPNVPPTYRLSVAPLESHDALHIDGVLRIYLLEV